MKRFSDSWLEKHLSTYPGSWTLVEAWIWCDFLWMKTFFNFKISKLYVFFEWLMQLYEWTFQNEFLSILDSLKPPHFAQTNHRIENFLLRKKPDLTSMIASLKWSFNFQSFQNVSHLRDCHPLRCLFSLLLRISKQSLIHHRKPWEELNSYSKHARKRVSKYNSKMLRIVIKINQLPNYSVGSSFLMRMIIKRILWKLMVYLHDPLSHVVAHTEIWL